MFIWNWMVDYAESHDLKYDLPMQAITLLFVFAILANTGRILDAADKVAGGRAKGKGKKGNPLLEAIRGGVGGLSGLLKGIRSDKSAGRIAVGILWALAIVFLVRTTVFSVGNYVWYKEDFGKFRYDSFLNAYEFYHYYIGSKYARELGYNNLYAATLVADDETGLKFTDWRGRKVIRDLATGGRVPIERVLKERDKYKGLFSQSRWEEFVDDIRWFKTQHHASRWSGMINDKGYNSTPIWSMVVGGVFANLFGTLPEWQINFLACLDLILIAIAAGCVIWAFGPLPAMFMLILLGTHYMMHWWHMKGAFLRTDFCMSLVIAVCLLKKERHGWAGLFTGWAICSRIFPAVFLFGIGAKLFWDLMGKWHVAWGYARDRFPRASQQRALLVAAAAGLAALSLLVLVVLNRLPLEGHDLAWPPSLALQALVLFPGLFVFFALAALGLWCLFTGNIHMGYVRYFIAVLLTIGALFGASVVHWNGLDLWKEYAQKIGKHNNDISTWRVGFKYIFIGQLPEELSAPSTLWMLAKNSLGFEVDPDPGGKLREARKEPEAGTAGSIIQYWQPGSRSSLYTSHKLLWRIIMISVLAVCLVAFRGLKDHEALAASFVPCFFLVSPTYYYYIMLLIPLLFFAPNHGRLPHALAMAWMFLTAAAGYYFYSMWSQDYATYYWQSWMVLVTALTILFMALFRGRHWLHGLVYAGCTLGMVLGFLLVWPLDHTAPLRFNGENLGVWFWTFAALLFLGAILAIEATSFTAPKLLERLPGTKGLGLRTASGPSPAANNEEAPRHDES